MNNAKIISFIVFASLSLPLLSIDSVFAEGTTRDIISRKYEQERDICKVVKSAIRDGTNAQEVTRTSILLGHDACVVIRCAIDAHGDLQQVITGALEAGTTSDVCSRCAIDAGANAAEVAKILETGLGYSPVSGGGLAPVEIHLPGGGKPGERVLSPSTPR